MACWGGRLGQVGLLFEGRDVHPDSSGQFHPTPVSWVGENGNEEAAKPPLERKDVNPNASSNRDGTPLVIEARNGHNRVAELLQARHSRPILYFSHHLIPQSLSSFLAEIVIC